MMKAPRFIFNLVKNVSRQHFQTAMASNAVKMDEAFEKIRSEIVSEARSLAPGLNEVADWIDKLLGYNVPHGKKFRAGLVIDTFSCATRKEIADTKRWELVLVVGWCVELLQASFLVIDDIMDSSEMRRGSPCWYKLSQVGLMACNDGLLLQSFIYSLLSARRDTLDPVVYADLIDLFHSMSRRTMYGQTLDCLSTPMGSHPDLRRLTAERFNTIVEYKTAFYSFVLPVRAGLYLAGVNDIAAHDRATAILKLLSYYFQTQDDFMDCYSEPEITGKIGTDIEDGKCSWLVVKALQLIESQKKSADANVAAEAERMYKTLCENYGRRDERSVAVVKGLYKKLQLDQEFIRFEENYYQEIADLIKEEDANLQELYLGMLNKLFKRNK